MKPLTKNDLLAKAKQLHKAGHENLHATHDGYFFTDPDNANAHAKTIDSAVHKFDHSELSGETSEDNKKSDKATLAATLDELVSNDAELIELKVKIEEVTAAEGPESESDKLKELQGLWDTRFKIFHEQVYPVKPPAPPKAPKDRNAGKPVPPKKEKVKPKTNEKKGKK